MDGLTAGLDRSEAMRQAIANSIEASIGERPLHACFFASVQFQSDAVAEQLRPMARQTRRRPESLTAFLGSFVAIFST